MKRDDLCGQHVFVCRNDNVRKTLIFDGIDKKFKEIFILRRWEFVQISSLNFFFFPSKSNNLLILILHKQSNTSRSVSLFLYPSTGFNNSCYIEMHSTYSKSCVNIWSLI